MGAIAKKYFLLKNYEDYADIFLKKKIIKFFKLKDAEHLINLILKKNLSYKLIYNLSIQELEILWEYFNLTLNKK